MKLPDHRVVQNSVPQVGRLAPATPSEAACTRMFSLPREPLLIGDWVNVMMIHLEVEPEAPRTATPFELDLWEGRAFATLVAFTLRGMRLRFGSRLTELLFKPLASHQFLDVRTYVRHGNEAGIHFLAEWLDSRLAVALGPPVFSLPYRHGHIHYQNEWRSGELRGRVVDAVTGTALEYHAVPEVGAPNFKPCAAGSLGEWLMERYTAFNCATGRHRFFRVWHQPWPQVPALAQLGDCSLLSRHWPFLQNAPLIGDNYSSGVRDVWMGWPHVL